MAEQIGIVVAVLAIVVGVGMIAAETHLRRREASRRFADHLEDHKALLAQQERIAEAFKVSSADWAEQLTAARAELQRHTTSNLLHPESKA